MFSVDNWQRKEGVDRNSFSCVGSLFHALGAATEKALSPIRRRVRGTTRSPDDEARSADRAGTPATDVSQSEMYTGVCPRIDLWTIRHILYWILSATGNQCNSWRAGVTRWCGLRSRTVGLRAVAAWNTIRYDTRCYFNVRSKADISQLNLPHRTDN